MLAPSLPEVQAPHSLGEVAASVGPSVAVRPGAAELRRREGLTLGHRWGWRSSVPSPIAATSTARMGGWLGASRWASLVKADQCAYHFINHLENQDLHPVCPRMYDAASAASRACGCARGMR